VSTKRGRYGNPAKRRPLAGDLARLAQPSGVADPRRLGGDIRDFGGPHDQDAVLIDTTDCVLLDHTEVCVMDTVRAGERGEQAIFMNLDGRINNRTDRVRVGYVLNTDGAAAIITELLALADRAGPDLLDDVTRRLTALYQDKNVDLHWLRAAIDNAIEAGAER
jgi:hypothetical protein